MRFYLLLFFFISCHCIAGAQATAHQLVSEGIALHEKGDYAGAIAKYDAALAADPSNYMAIYEKGYTLLSLKNYDAAGNLFKKVLKQSKDPAIRKHCFITYGTLLDMQGERKKSLKIYNQGIKEFPSDYLLYFNKGVTQAGMNDSEGAVASFKQALVCNPLHASSHNALAQMLSPDKRIPAILSLFTFLLIEPQGSRAEQNLERLDRLIMQGIKKEDNKNITINIPADLLDKKKSRKEDDFSSAELLLSLLAASGGIADSLGAKTDADKLGYQLQSLIAVIGEQGKQDKGFFHTFYLPMFMEMKKNDLVTIASYIVMQAAGKADITGWLEENRDDTGAFYRWFENYQWIKE